MFERQTIEVFDWCSFTLLFTFSESKAFAGEALVLGGISFLIHLSLVWTSDLFSHLTLETSIFTEDSPGSKHSWLANQSQIILYTFTTFWLVSQSNVLIYVGGRVSLPIIWFWLVIQSNHNIGVWLIKDPIPCFVGEYFFSL